MPMAFSIAVSERRLANDSIAKLGVKAPSADTLARNLSGGNQQKVALARWLMTDPKVLILDEPTQGIDVGAKSEIYHLIGRLAASGLAILMISSETPEILGLSDRIAVMAKGEIVGVLDRAEANPRPDSRDGAGPSAASGEPRMKLGSEREWPALTALALLYLFLAMAAPGFYHLENLRDLALANVSVLLVAAGMTLVIVIGQIDISVGSLFAVTSVAYGVLVKAGLPLLLAPFAAILIGAVLGAINGGLDFFCSCAVDCGDFGHHDCLARITALEHGRCLGGRSAGQFSVVRPGSANGASRYRSARAASVCSLLVGLGEPFGLSRDLRHRLR